MSSKAERDKRKQDDDDAQRCTCGHPKGTHSFGPQPENIGVYININDHLKCNVIGCACVAFTFTPFDMNRIHRAVSNTVIELRQSRADAVLREQSIARQNRQVVI